MKRFLALIALTLLLTLPAISQFGKQLVDYQKHGWKYLETEHFRIFFYGQTEAMLPQLAYWTENAYQYLTQKLDYQPLPPPTIIVPAPLSMAPITITLPPLKSKEKIPVIFYADRANFYRTKIAFGYPPIGANAFAEPLHWRYVMPVNYDPEMMSALITHELAHVFQFSCWYKGRQTLIEMIWKDRSNVTWYFEAFSQHLSGDHLIDPVDIYLTRLLVLKDFIPAVRTWEKIDNYLTNYNLAPTFLDFIAEKYGPETIKKIFHEIGVVGPTDQALGRIIHQILQKSFGQVDLEFRDWLRNKYRHLYSKHEAHFYGTNLHLVEEIQPQPLAAPVSNYQAMRGQPVQKKKVEFLYEPAVSPDGKTIAGWTEWKGKFTLVLAEAEDCTFIKDLTPGYSLRKYGIWPEFNPYFGEGRGLSWSRSNPDKLVYIAETLEKHPALIIIDPNTRKHQKISLPFDEPCSPVMTNDGQKVAFSARKNGQSDLFLFDLKTREFENLTSDENFDFAPSFPPDQQTGQQTIVYVSVEFGERKLFLLNLESREKKQLTFGDSNEIRPIFLTSEKILFLSDFGSDKIYNIYTLELKTGKIEQLTDLTYGVVSVFPKPSQITFSVPICGINLALPTYNQILFSAPDYRDWLHVHEFNLYQTDLATLEPKEVEFDSSTVTHLPLVLEDPEKLASQVKKYKPEFYTQQRGMLGFDSWYGFYGQGFFWIYDLFGEHQFVLDFLGYGKYFQEVNARYYNQRGRTPWGLNFYRYKSIMYPWWYFGSLEQPAIDKVFEYLWIDQNSLALWKIYPLDICHRLEFSLSANSVKFNYADWSWESPLRAEFLDRYFNSGQFLKGTFSLVHDTVGYSNQTGQPMTGSASRLDLNFSTGNFQKGISFELRKYFRLSNLSTLAWRGLFVRKDGRAISPVIVGDFGELRGYRVAQFTGNQLILTNLELRVPLIHEIRSGLFRVENVRGAIFIDLTKVEWSEKKFNLLNYDNFSSQRWKGAFGLDIDLGSIDLPFFGIKNFHLVIAQKFALPKFEIEKKWTYRFYFGYSF